MKKFKLFLSLIKRMVCAVWRIMCALWDNYTPIKRKPIDAKDLVEICEMLTPSFDKFLKHLPQRRKINEQQNEKLFNVFNSAFATSFPEKMSAKEWENFNSKCDSILRGPHFLSYEIDFSSLDFLPPDFKTVLARIKEKGLEKHIVFYDHFFPSLIESFKGAIRQFITERLYGNTKHEDKAYLHLINYMSKWSFIFNRTTTQASPIIEIRNLKITGDIRVALSRFKYVIVSRNIFCGNVDIDISIPLPISHRNGVVLSKNTFCNWFGAIFTNTAYPILERNDFKREVLLIHFFDNSEYIPEDRSIHPIIRLIKNKINKSNKSWLWITANKEKNITHFADIKIEFLRENRMVGFFIEAGKNQLGNVAVSADIEKIYFDEHEQIKPPTNADVNTLRDYKNFFLELKNQAIKKKDRAAEFNYARKERYFDGQLSPRWEDKLIFGWSEFVSKSGISWGKPLLILATLQAVCIFLPVWYIEDCKLGLTLAIETLNPLTLLSAKLTEKSSWISALAIFQKIYLAILLYEIIKVVRRFSK